MGEELMYVADKIKCRRSITGVLYNAENEEMGYWTCFPGDTLENVWVEPGEGQLLTLTGDLGGKHPKGHCVVIEFEPIQLFEHLTDDGRSHLIRGYFAHL